MPADLPPMTAPTPTPQAGTAGDDPLAGLINQNNNNGPTVSDPPDPNAPIQVAAGDPKPSDPNAPQGDASTGSSKPTTPTTSDDKPDEPTGPNDAEIKVLQDELNKRQVTNGKLQQACDDFDATTLKEYFKNAPIDAKGNINKDTFDKLPREVQREMKAFEKGHYGRDASHAAWSFSGAAANIFSDGQFYVNHGRIEMKRNELFIKQLQAKIDTLKASR
jgi:hypothetical protein